MIKTARRLGEGGRIDRARRLHFRFDGNDYAGHPGDTLASALLASGVRVVGRSFKYHRPRGIVTAGVEEPNAIVQLTGEEDEPGVRATTLPLREGLCAESVNRWPGLHFDVGAVNDLLSPLLPAGFYYKTLFGGAGWNLHGRIVRRLAGLGRAPRSAPAHRYEKRFHHCDVLVVGAGPAGLAAALTAVRASARVLLVDEAPEPGGQLLDGPALIEGAPALEWVARASAEIDECRDAVRLAGATVCGYYDHDLLTVLERAPRPGVHERLWKVRARQVVLATGATERPLVFADNDRPGVMLAHAARTYARRYGVLTGRRAVLVTNNSSGYDAAFDLHALGLDVAGVVDTRAEPPPTLLADARSRGIPAWPGHTVAGVAGARGVERVRVAPRTLARAWRRVACDLVLVSGGWSPAVHLASQTGARPVYEPRIAAFVPGAPVRAERSAGAARGVLDLAGCLADGARAGRAALAALGVDTPRAAALAASPTRPLDIEPVWRLESHGRAKAFVDLQHDVTDEDISLAVREGFESVEHVKRYTTAGMGTDQGKLGNTNAIGLLAEQLGREPGAVGTTTYRPPYAAMSFGAIAGNDLGEVVVPSRRTAITGWIEASGATMFEAGRGWRRPACFPRGGESMADAIQREARACRTAAGIYDGSPLGKLDLQGRDAAAFLERVCTNRWADLAVGHGRFGLMLHEDGRLLDDVVAFRLAEHRFWLFSGTGAFDQVMLHLTRLAQLEWPGLNVHLTPVTSQWANVCVCGPRARAVLRDAGTSLDLEPAGFPFMALRHGDVAGLPACVARVGYTGELSYEVNVRRRDGLALWQALIEAGAAHGLTPIGSEASMVMRCEKGFVAVGLEGDGIVNPYDAGLGWVVDESKPDFVGKRSLERDRRVGGTRPQVVGLLPRDRDFVPPDGTPIVDGLDAHGAPRVIGHVTQGCRSPNLERAIALALLDDGRARVGDRVTLAAVAGEGWADVVGPCFIDPQGGRMR